MMIPSIKATRELAAWQQLGLVLQGCPSVRRLALRSYVPRPGWAAAGSASSDVVDYVCLSAWPRPEQPCCRSKFARPSSVRTPPWTFSQDVAIDSPD